MEHEEILTALEEISDTHIAEAEKPPKKKGRIVRSSTSPSKDRMKLRIAFP